MKSVNFSYSSPMLVSLILQKHIMHKDKTKHDSMTMKPHATNSAKL